MNIIEEGERAKQEVLRRLTEWEQLKPLIKSIQAALDTEEEGEALVEVARNACKAEKKVAFEQGATWVLHESWSQCRFFTGKDEGEAEAKAVAYILKLSADDRKEYEAEEGPVDDDAWLEILMSGEWSMDTGFICTEN